MFSLKIGFINLKFLEEIWHQSQIPARVCFQALQDYLPERFPELVHFAERPSQQSVQQHPRSQIESRLALAPSQRVSMRCQNGEKSL